MDTHLASLIASLGFAPGTEEFNTLYTESLANLEESKHLGTHGGNAYRRGRANRMGNPRLRQSRTTRAREYLTGQTKAFEKAFTGLANSFIDGRLSEPEFKKAAKEELRKVYLNNFMHGLKTGSHLDAEADIYQEVADSDLKWVRSAFNHEAKYLTSFLNDIVRGISGNELRRRVKAYAQASEAVFDSARVLSLPSTTLVHWLIDPTEPCPGCIMLKQWSPYPSDLLPTTPKAGLTQCLNNCLCVLRFVQATSKQVAEARDRLGSVESLLSQLHRLKRRR